MLPEVHPARCAVQLSRAAVVHSEVCLCKASCCLVRATVEGAASVLISSLFFEKA